MRAFEDRLNEADQIEAEWLTQPRLKSPCGLLVLCEDPLDSGIVSAWVERWCLRHGRFWPIEISRYERSQVYAVRLRRMPQWVKKQYLNQEPKRIRLHNSAYITFVDPKGIVPESTKGKALQIHKALNAPTSVVFVIHSKRQSGSHWRGMAYHRVPLKRLSWCGKRYDLSRAAFKMSIRVGLNMGPAGKDVYRDWTGSVTGEGTLLHVIAHELVHHCMAVEGRKFHTPRGEEHNCNARASEVCEELFPDLFVDKEEWHRRFADVQALAATTLLREHKSTHGGCSANIESLKQQKETTMQVGTTDRTARVDVRVGKGKEAEVIKVFEATAEQVDKVVTPVLPEADLVTVRVKLAGKGNKPFIHKVGGTQEAILKTVKAALTAAAGKPSGNSAKK